MERSGPLAADRPAEAYCRTPSPSARAAPHNGPAHSAWTRGCGLRRRSTGSAGIDRERACRQGTGRSPPPHDGGTRCTRSRPGRCRPPATRRLSPERPHGLGSHSSGGDSSSVQGRRGRCARTTVACGWLKPIWQRRRLQSSRNYLPKDQRAGHRRFVCGPLVATSWAGTSAVPGGAPRAPLMIRGCPLRNVAEVKPISKGDAAYRTAAS